MGFFNIAGAGLRSYSSMSSGRKVAVLGAAGGIGQPLSLLLKSTPSSITRLSLYDINNVGMSVDLSHIPTCATVTGHSGDSEKLAEALEGCDVVMIPAGVPRKPGMTRDDLFNINAGIVRNLSAACAEYIILAILCDALFVGLVQRLMCWSYPIP